MDRKVNKLPSCSDFVGRFHDDFGWINVVSGVGCLRRYVLVVVKALFNIYWLKFAGIFKGKFKVMFVTESTKMTSLTDLACRYTMKFSEISLKQHELCLPYNSYCA